MPTPTTPRPKRSDALVITAAALALAPKVIEWTKQVGSENEGDTVESVAEELKEAIYREDDGYRIAKNLEDAGWEPDAALVEILDGATFAKSTAHNDAMREWMKTSGLTAPAIGARVRSVNERWKQDHTGLVGTVVEHCEDRGQSTVAFAELGHGVRSASGSKTIGVILAWENLEVVPEETPAPTA